MELAVAVSDSFLEKMRQEESTELASMECSPFTEEFIPQHFHPEISRLNLLKNIRQDLAEGVPIVVVTGDPGSGKSVIGRMLASESPDGNNCIYFDKTVIAFENVVKTVARVVGVEVTDISRKGIAAAVEKIAERVEALSYRLTLIFDGAERIYLATLERIRKMLDRLNTEGVCMQVVFLGRAGLLDNLTQLSICNLNDVSEKRYALQPLSLSETALYLEMCVGSMSQADASLFDTETVEHIYHVSRGNFRKINQCAERLLKRLNSHPSGSDLLNSAGDYAIAPETDGKVRRSFFALSDYPAQVKLIVGGTLAATLAVGLIIASGNKEHEGPATEPVAHRQPVETTAKALSESMAPEKVLAKTAQPESVSKSEGGVFPAEEPGTEQSVGQQEGQQILNTADSEQADIVVDRLSGEPKEGAVQMSADAGKVEMLEESDDTLSQQEAPPVVSADEAEEAIVRIEPQSAAKKNLESPTEVTRPLSLKKELSKRIVAENSVVSELQVEDNSSAVIAASNTTLSEAEAVGQAFSAEDVHRVFEEPLEYVPTEQKLLGGQESKIYQEQVASVLDVQKASAELVMNTAAEGSGTAAEPKKVVKPREATVARIDSEKAKTKKTPVVGAALVEQQEAATAGTAQPEPAAEDLYLNRLAAGQSWLNGDNDGKYTMQLMVLSDENARVNIERMLISDGYRQEVDNLFILEGEQNPAQVYVFYGEYESMEAARKARDTVSEVLKEHNPYVLSVRLAVQKLLNRDIFKG